MRGLGLQSSAGARVRSSSPSPASRTPCARYGAPLARRALAPAPRAASSQLSETELKELIAENAKLRQLLATYKNRLAPEQVARLTKQYEEIAALAAAAGLELEPLELTPEQQAQQAQQAAAAAAAAAPAPAAAAPAAASKAEAQAVEIGEATTKKAAAAAAPAVAAAASSGGGSSKPSRWRTSMQAEPAQAAQAPKQQQQAAAAAAPPQPRAEAPVKAPAAPAMSAPAKAPAPPPPPPPAARSSRPPPVPPQLQQQPRQPPAANPDAQDYTAPAPTSPLFGGARPGSSSSGSSSGSSNGVGTALVDVGPPPAPVKEEDVLDIPDPVEQAAKVVSSVSKEERARREAAKQKQRAATQQLLASHDPTASAADRHSWLIYTVPEKPVAGCETVVYYNRSQSQVLRDRNRIQLLLGFNHWELAAEQAKVDLYPSPIPHVDGSDFWSCRFKVPEDAYEINFVFTDGESLYDNNEGQDFTYPAEAGLTWDEWQAAAAERAAAIEAERAKAEAERLAEDAKRDLEEREKRDKDNAAKRVAELRDGYGWLTEGATMRRKVDAADETSKTYWYVTPKVLTPGSKGTLLYNSKAGPLAWIEDKRTNKTRTATVEGQAVPKVLLGFNNWKVKRDPLPMQHSSVQGDEDELWWEASFEVPKDAVAVNFVVNCDNAWDNNGGKDHKIAVALPAPHKADDVAAWADTLFDGFAAEERAARLAAEKAAAEKEAKRVTERTAAKERAKAVLRRQMKHVMFTEPEVIKAGERVTVFYCPDDTALAGTSQVYFTGGFNRWSHKRSLGPVAMRPPAGGGRHWEVRFSVPKDAQQLDFVFSNVPGGDGTYDNRGGFDYHLPIEGGTGTMPNRLHVAHIAVEMAPIAKVGGLGDVVTALGRAVQEEGHLVEVLLPRYDFFMQSPLLVGQLRYETEFDWGGTRIYVTSAVVEGLRCFFIEPKNGFFATPTVYGRYDDEVRFDFFCKAALEFLLKTGRQPDILHCHDWSTAHVAKSFWEDYQPYGLWKPKVVFTIHNMNYGQKKISEAAYYCQKFTTVSPTYAFEVGAHPTIAGNAHKFLGIRNGIDTELWSPSDNKFLPQQYDADSAEEGKRMARVELRRRVNLTDWNDKPIVAVVSRLTPQKGVHLIKHAAYKALDRGCQFVLLGSAPDPKVQAEFDELANELGHGQDASFVFAYDEPLSHIIYAASDVILVPSMFEPCGLTQMIAMRYGSVPVVRHTGGLRDTVFDVDSDKARAAWETVGSSDWQRDKVDETNGFAFEGTDEGGFDYAFNRCIDAYYNDRAWFRSLQSRIMRQDWSWNRPAIDYVELYYSAQKG